MHGLDLEKSTRYATTFQNRMIKGMQALAALDMHERQRQQFDRLEVQNAAFVTNHETLVLANTALDEAELTSAKVKEKGA